MHSRIPHFSRFVICVPLLLTACAVTRVAPPAPATAPAAFKEDTPWQRGTGAATAAVPDDWWSLFGDPQLNGLEARLVVGNENLKSLAAQLASARAAVEASRSALFPTLSVSGGATRDGNPAQTTGNGASISNTANSMTLGANAAWEVDLWGRLSQASEGAQASAQASADDLAAARLSAQSTLAQTYFSLRTSDAQLELLTGSVAAYQRSLDLTQARYDGGVAARSDVLQAQTQLKSAQAQLADMSAQRATLEHAIAVLLGIPPSALEVKSTVTGVAGLPAVPPVPELLPSTLLERRPDIAAAQRRVAAAYAQIGVADASYFPALSLSASAGYRNTSLSNLVSAPNFLWSLGSSLTQAIFDGGQRKLASAQARATADQATSTYRQSVLTALQEVEDNLVLTTRLREEVAYQSDAVAAAQRNLAITNDQYAGGTVSYLNVVTAQTAAYTSESSLLTVQNRQLAATAILLKNIAGRWQPDVPVPAPAPRS